MIWKRILWTLTEYPTMDNRSEHQNWQRRCKLYCKTSDCRKIWKQTWFKKSKHVVWHLMTAWVCSLSHARFVWTLLGFSLPPHVLGKIFPECTSKAKWRVPPWYRSCACDFFRIFFFLQATKCLRVGHKKASGAFSSLTQSAKFRWVQCCWREDKEKTLREKTARHACASYKLAENLSC